MKTPRPARSHHSWQQPHVSRRALIAMAAMAPILTACGSSSGSPTGSSEPLETLRIRHPHTLAFAAPFLLIEKDGTLQQYATTVDVGEWSSPDMLRSMLVNGKSAVTAVPTYVGANLANRGIEVRMAAVTVWGLLWLIGPEGAAPGWESLRGEKVMIPLPNDMPDLVFRFLANANGLERDDYQVEYFAQMPEVVSRLVSGEGTWAVLPEHMATVALSQARQNDRRLTRFMNLQEAWAGVTGGQPRIPQAGIVVSSQLAEQRPELIGAVLDELAAAVGTVNAANSQTVATITTGTGVPEQVVADVIPRLNLEVVPADQARTELEAFYTNLATLSPDIIGGRLPDASFYLADPR